MLRKKWMEEVECRAHRLKFLDTVLKRDRYFRRWAPRFPPFLRGKCIWSVRSIFPFLFRVFWIWRIIIRLSRKFIHWFKSDLKMIFMKNLIYHDFWTTIFVSFERKRLIFLEIYIIYTRIYIYMIKIFIIEIYIIIVNSYFHVLVIPY